MRTCAYKGEVGPKNWSQGVHVQNGWTLTVLLKDLPGLLILKIFNIVGIYTSKFFPSNYRTLITNYNVHERKTLVCPVFQRIYYEDWSLLSFFKMTNMIRLHHGTFIAYSHIFSCYSKIFYNIFSFGQL